jgi:hypothetical protein
MFLKRRHKRLEYILLLMMVLPFGCKHATETEPEIQNKSITDLRNIFNYATGQTRIYRKIEFLFYEADTTTVTMRITECDTTENMARFLFEGNDTLTWYRDIYDSSEYLRDFTGLVASSPANIPDTQNSSRRYHKMPDAITAAYRLLRLPVKNGEHWEMSFQSHTPVDSLTILSTDSTVTIVNKVYHHAIVVQGIWHEFIFVPHIGLVMDEENGVDTYTSFELIDKNF